MKIVAFASGVRLTQRVRSVLQQLVSRAAVLGAIGLVAIGLSGAVAGLFGWTVGLSYVAGDVPGTRYSAARCTDLREYAPHARTCEQAATDHHFSETISYRGAAGVLGLGLAAAAAVVRRRRPGLLASDRLPVAFDATVGATVFGLAGGWLLASGIDRTVLGEHGAGFFTSGAVVAIPIAVWFVVRWFRAVVAAGDLGPVTSGR